MKRIEFNSSNNEITDFIYLIYNLLIKLNSNDYINKIVEEISNIYYTKRKDRIKIITNFLTNLFKFCKNQLFIFIYNSHTYENRDSTILYSSYKQLSIRIPSNELKKTNEY